jgi:hypothetical protein
VVVVVGGVVVVVVGGRVVVVGGWVVVVVAPPEDGVVVVVGLVPLPATEPPELGGAELPPVDAGAVVDGDCEWDDVLLLPFNGPLVLAPESRFGAPPPTTLPAEAGVLGAWLFPEDDPVVPAGNAEFSSPQSLAVVLWVVVWTPGSEAETELPAPPRTTPIPRLITAPAMTNAVPRRRRTRSPTPREATAATRKAYTKRDVRGSNQLAMAAATGASSIMTLDWGRDDARKGLISSPAASSAAGM